nr:MAG TPA: hypothetical protein [Caudoviricetes sp.]
MVQFRCSDRLYLTAYALPSVSVGGFVVCFGQNLNYNFL